MRSENLMRMTALKTGNTFERVKRLARDFHAPYFHANCFAIWLLCKKQADKVHFAKYKRTRYASGRSERVLEINRNWANRNKEKVRTMRREYNRARVRNDIAYRMARILRTRVKAAVNRRANYKAEKTMHLIGCSIHTLMRHLEELFQEGMNWQNYGKWHVDHIKPCASFNLSEPAQQRACSNFKNLQPLWALDNLRKGARVE